MGQRTLYSKDFLRLAEDFDEPSGDLLWIGDDLDEMEVSLSREQLIEILPLLKAWCEQKHEKE